MPCALAFIVETLMPSRPAQAAEVAEEILEVSRGMERPPGAVGPLCDAAAALVGESEAPQLSRDCFREAFDILSATLDVDAYVPVEECLTALEGLPLPVLREMLPPFLEAAQTASAAVLRELGRIQRLLMRIAGEDWDPDDYLRDIDFAESVAMDDLVA
jgi:hypothetical protein